MLAVKNEYFIFQYPVLKPRNCKYKKTLSGPSATFRVLIRANQRSAAPLPLRLTVVARRKLLGTRLNFLRRCWRDRSGLSRPSFQTQRMLEIENWGGKFSP
jgi:hypothetical protein